MTPTRHAAPLAALAGAALALSACAGLGGAGGGLLPSAPIAGGGAAPPGGPVAYTCPGGTFFDTLYEPATTAFRLRVDGATSHPHTLDRLVTPDGQTSYQDAEYRLVPGPDPSRVTLIPRAPAAAPLACTRVG